uniref:cellulase n=1 Tax=uncultured symbiotic protist of Neotermes koshunensis TaxID=403660 RepID=A4UWX3_9EUKA|nr:putative glycosyl hydrolase family7 [uncultured symbiotic protist of Neotermes koshunensis]
MFLALASLVGCAEKHPPFTWEKCTKAGCTKVNGYLVHDKHIGNVWDRGSDQLDYENEVGVTVSGGTLQQKLVNKYKGQKVIGSRLYILDDNDQYYQLFNFVGKEFTYTVDMSEIPCGVNAALYTAEMPKAGKPPGGTAIGTGYCDANCVDGSCCAEFDIQEASSKAMVYTAHMCTSQNNGCDSSGCGYNPYRDSKAYNFWGGTIDVTKPVTVVTQFIGAGTSMSAVRRKYVQNGKVIDSPGMVNNSYCNWVHCQCPNGDWNPLIPMAGSFARGHVVVFSLWDGNGMMWMDGGNNGPCKSYDVASVEATRPNLKVTWSKVRFGDIDSTY